MTKYIKLTICAAILILLVVIVFWVRSAFKGNYIELGSNENIDLTPTQIQSIRDIGEWEFLSISAEEMVDTVRKGIFTDDEWDAMSSNQQGGYVTIGIRVRAERQCFLISKSDMKTSGGAYTMLWSAEQQDVPGLTNYGAENTGMYDDFDAATMTSAAVTFAEQRGVAYLPFQLARAYKGCTVEDDGVDDPVEWSVATVAHLRIMSKYRTQINAAITRHIGSAYNLLAEFYWSANEYSYQYAWRFHLGSGSVINVTKVNGYSRVRAVSAL